MKDWYNEKDAHYEKQKAQRDAIKADRSEEKKRKEEQKQKAKELVEREHKFEIANWATLEKKIDVYVYKIFFKLIFEWKFLPMLL